MNTPPEQIECFGLRLGAPVRAGVRRSFDSMTWFHTRS